MWSRFWLNENKNRFETGVFAKHTFRLGCRLGICLRTSCPPRWEWYWSVLVGGGRLPLPSLWYPESIFFQGRAIFSPMLGSKVELFTPLWMGCFAGSPLGNYGGQSASIPPFHLPPSPTILGFSSRNIFSPLDGCFDWEVHLLNSGYELLCPVTFGSLSRT